MTVAGTVAPIPFVSVKLIVPACTLSLKLAMTVVRLLTAVASEAGVSAVTVAGDGPVMNSQLTGDAMGVPALFWAPLTVAV